MRAGGVGGVWGACGVGCVWCGVCVCRRSWVYLQWSVISASVQCRYPLHTLSWSTPLPLPREPHPHPKYFPSKSVFPHLACWHNTGWHSGQWPHSVVQQAAQLCHDVHYIVYCRFSTIPVCIVRSSIHSIHTSTSGRMAPPASTRISARLLLDRFKDRAVNMVVKLVLPVLSPAVGSSQY